MSDVTTECHQAAVPPASTPGPPDDLRRILLIHNYYQQAGGEDECFAADRILLEERGHEVHQYIRDNAEVKRIGRVAAALQSVWSAQSYREIRALVRRLRPSVVHFTNTFPLISPAAYHAARSSGAAVVQTLHNYRLICPGALLYRDGAVCEQCLDHRLPWPAVVHRCYRGSRAGSATVAAMLVTHRLAGTWKTQVDAYVALTAFAKDRFVRAGFDPATLHVCPNYLAATPPVGDGRPGFVLFAGRLAPEKGIAVLLEAWQRMPGAARLVIAGDGPEAASVRAAAARDGRIDWLGRRTPEEVLDLAGQAACLVLPSLWYEGFSRVILEAYARGTPVVASDMGGMSSIVQHERTGLRFRPGDAADLARALSTLLNDESLNARMRAGSRQEFEERYTAAAGYRGLIRVYTAARRRRTHSDKETP